MSRNVICSISCTLIECSIIRSSTYDKKNTFLYFYDITKADFKRIITCDLKTKNTMTCTKGLWSVSNFRSELIYAENKLHRICNYETTHVEGGQHLVRDKTYQIHTLTYFKPFDGLFGFSLLYLQTQKRILSFGGAKTVGYSDSIYQFSCVESKWKELNVKIPMKFSEFGIVSAKNERYIILFGGLTNGNKLCFGFVKDSYNKKHFAHIQLPEYLIKIIYLYFGFEEQIYLMQRRSLKHCEIDIDCILQQ